MAAQPPLPSPPPAARSPEVLRHLPLYPQPHPSSHGRGRLLPIGAAVRGGGGRHSDPHRPLARAGRVLPGRQRGLGNRPNSGRGGGAHHAFTTGRREHRRRRPGEGAGTPHLHPKGGGAGELPSSRPPFSPNVRKVVLILSRTCLRAISGGRIWKVITPELGFRHSISA